MKVCRNLLHGVYVFLSDSRGHGSTRWLSVRQSSLHNQLKRLGDTKQLLSLSQVSKGLWRSRCCLFYCTRGNIGSSGLQGWNNSLLSWFTVLRVYMASFAGRRQIRGQTRRLSVQRQGCSQVLRKLWNTTCVSECWGGNKGAKIVCLTCRFEQNCCTEKLSMHAALAQHPLLIDYLLN